MANDPSMNAWGWVVLNQWGKVIDRGVIKTEPKAKLLRIRKGDDNARRIREMNSTLIEVVKKYDVQYLLSELPHGSQSAVAAFMLGAAISIMDTISSCFNIGVEWYNEGDCKENISGKKSLGSKNEMVRLIKQKYKVKWFGADWKDQGIADALAVYDVAKQQSSTLKFLER